jgi:bacterioferritin-associated ferredoxin
MFLCSCGGVFIVKRIEEYPLKLTRQEQFNYLRKCDVQCGECRKEIKDQPYDSPQDANKSEDTTFV